jgi:osmotically-inducible protein OsmY
MRLLLIPILIFSLSGCVSGIIGGALLTSGIFADILNDRRNNDIRNLDNELTKKINEYINNDNLLSTQASLDILVYNQIVLITGQTSNANLIQRTINILRPIANIKKIHNYINIGHLLSSGVNINDKLINDNINSTLIKKLGFNSKLVQNITANDGVVYLMGLLTTEEQQNITNIVRKVSGVQRVIPAFQKVRLIPEF